MVCSNYGQYIHDGIKFCTKCGAKCSAGWSGTYNILSYSSLTISIIGIIARNIEYLLYAKILNFKSFNPSLYSIYGTFIFFGILLAIISLYKQKCKLAFIAGLVPCVYIILVILTWYLPFLRFLSRYITY